MLKFIKNLFKKKSKKLVVKVESEMEDQKVEVKFPTKDIAGSQSSTDLNPEVKSVIIKRNSDGGIMVGMFPKHWVFRKGQKIYQHKVGKFLMVRKTRNGILFGKVE